MANRHVNSSQSVGWEWAPKDLPSACVPSTRKPQPLRNTPPKQKITLYLARLNKLEVLSWGLPKFEVFQMPDFNWSWSIFHILLPAPHFSALKEDSTVFHPGKEAPTISCQWLPLAALGGCIRCFPRKYKFTHCSLYDGRSAGPGSGAMHVLLWVISALRKQGDMASLLHSSTKAPAPPAYEPSPLLHARIWFLPIPSQSNRKNPAPEPGRSDAGKILPLQTLGISLCKNHRIRESRGEETEPRHTGTAELHWTTASNSSDKPASAQPSSFPHRDAALQNSAGLHHTLKHLSHPANVHLIIPIVHKSPPGWAQGKHKVFARPALLLFPFHVMWIVSVSRHQGVNGRKNYRGMCSVQG